MAKRRNAVKPVEGIYHNRTVEIRGGQNLIQPIVDEPPNPSNTEIIALVDDHWLMRKSRSKRLQVTNDMPGGPGTFEPRSNERYK